MFVLIKKAEERDRSWAEQEVEGIRSNRLQVLLCSRMFCGLWKVSGFTLSSATEESPFPFQTDRSEL